MSEVTKIINVQITIIRKGENAKYALIPEEQAKEMIADEIKSWLDAEDVVVESVQDFVRENAGEKEIHEEKSN